MSDEADSLITLMRDTALHAALLSSGAMLPPAHVWRARCLALAEALRQAMLDAGYPASAAEEASLAQCVLLDELSLRALPAGQRDEWLREPLQASLHEVTDGAARVWARIDALLRGERQNRLALEWYGIVLTLGFEGGRRDRDDVARRLWTMLDGAARPARHAAMLPSRQLTLARSGPVEPAEPPPLRISPTPPPPPRGALSILPGFVIGVIVPAVLAVALWIFFDARLGEVAGRLASSEVLPVAIPPQGDAQ
ncbi:DotU family type IV/VI secretion system protein [Burkholderia glumae]|uniref:DotU family type IV/VI secretion system protein n=1 Tax=Burkholderia glumae TaxID=337 RepID=UPI0003A2378B|nr:DotU family type IV/VI secretion system protein [Burkholderia glumae]MCM2494423.1 DotU family type IV/VI secretion system protein [Burkholderia glumae]QJP69845.1 DotU family type IV/VI secretion system protein [Burkholderia glumae]